MGFKSKATCPHLLWGPAWLHKFRWPILGSSTWTSFLQLTAKKAAINRQISRQVTAITRQISEFLPCLEGNLYFVRLIYRHPWQPIHPNLGEWRLHPQIGESVLGVFSPLPNKPREIKTTRRIDEGNSKALRLFLPCLEGNLYFVRLIYRNPWQPIHPNLGEWRLHPPNWGIVLEPQPLHTRAKIRTTIWPKTVDVPFKCFFPPPSMRNGRSQFSAISMVFPRFLSIFNWFWSIFCHFQSVSVSFSQF